MKYQNYINGEWVGSADGKTFEQRNPANLEQVTGEWPKSTREDAQAGDRKRPCCVCRVVRYRGA